MENALHIGSGCMHRAMNGEAGRIDLSLRTIHHVAVQIDLDQIRRGHLVKTQAELVEQVNAWLPWNRS